MTSFRNQALSFKTVGSPKAFTLLELLIVLGLILLILGLSLPSMRRMMARTEFQGAVQDLKTELSKTRLLAMKTGTPYVFRYMPGTNVYEIVPKSVLEQAIQQENATPEVLGSLYDSGGIFGGTADANSDDLFNGADLGADFNANMNTGLNTGINVDQNGNPLNGLSGVSGQMDPMLQNSMQQNSMSSSVQTEMIRQDGSLVSDGSLLGSLSDGMSNGMSDEMSINGLNAETVPEQMDAQTGGVLSAQATGSGMMYRKVLGGKVIFADGTVSKSTQANLKTEVSPEAGDENLEQLGSEIVGSLDNPVEETEEEIEIWSEPILFYPNGKTSGAVILLANDSEYEYYSEIALRGLTGMSRISFTSISPPGAGNSDESAWLPDFKSLSETVIDPETGEPISSSSFSDDFGDNSAESLYMQNQTAQDVDDQGFVVNQFNSADDLFDASAMSADGLFSSDAYSGGMQSSDSLTGDLLSDDLSEESLLGGVPSNSGLSSSSGLSNNTGSNSNTGSNGNSGLNSNSGLIDSSGSISSGQFSGNSASSSTGGNQNIGNSSARTASTRTASAGTGSRTQRSGNTSAETSRTADSANSDANQ